MSNEEIQLLKNNYEKIQDQNSDINGRLIQLETKSEERHKQQSLQHEQLKESIEKVYNSLILHKQTSDDKFALILDKISLSKENTLKEAKSYATDVAKVVVGTVTILFVVLNFLFNNIINPKLNGYHQEKIKYKVVGGR